MGEEEDDMGVPDGGVRFRFCARSSPQHRVCEFHFFAARGGAGRGGAGRGVKAAEREREAALLHCAGTALDRSCRPGIPASRWTRLPLPPWRLCRRPAHPAQGLWNSVATLLGDRFWVWRLQENSCALKSGVEKGAIQPPPFQGTAEMKWAVGFFFFL
ncbi:PREDICTED: uncharacterized protein LOC105542592 [Mandrillus leucophaeus]|uniref:uncharacterized protein LOC105542592 n=1 Tax=Mandrillus leucophaeus TaxID=9568 RepID=UPI0005F37DA0|nr:PREDICTED: uncharacterized protein LOC105542592 [Mandrillus leucophaeus]